MAARKQSPADVLSLIAERAEDLRRAGVTSVAVDGFSFELAPYVEDNEEKRVDEPTYSDPLKDPSTYQNGRVPGFERESDAD